jgi:BASS family bile acid:Na+ symporter
VALSISFTALASLITTLTLPLILSVGGQALMGADLPAVSITGLVLKMFAMTTLPVLLGVLLHQQRPGLARRRERTCERVATLLFALILAITIVARLLRLPSPQVSCVAIESGFQNGTVGIAVGALLAGLRAGGAGGAGGAG